MVMKFAEPISSLLVAIVMIVSGIGLFQLMTFAPSHRLPSLHVPNFLCYQLRNIFTGHLCGAPDGTYCRPANAESAAGSVRYAALMKGSMWAGIAIGALIHLAFCLSILLFLSLKSSREAFPASGHLTTGMIATGSARFRGLR